MRTKNEHTLREPLKILGIIMSLLFVFTMPVVAFALGISPPRIELNPMIPGEAKTVFTTLSRVRTDTITYISSEVRGDIKKFVTVIDADKLIFPEGIKTMQVGIKVDATELKNGETISGQILFRETQNKGQSSGMGNFSGTILDVDVNVFDDDTALLKVDSVAFTWRESEKILTYSFMQRNERYVPARIQKAHFIFSPLDNPGTQIIREVKIEGEPVAPEKSQQQTGTLALDTELAGTFNISAEFFDEGGISIFTSTPTEITVHRAHAADNKKRAQYTLFAVAALAIAGLFIGDYLYLKRRRSRNH